MSNGVAPKVLMMVCPIFRHHFKECQWSKLNTKRNIQITEIHLFLEVTKQKNNQKTTVIINPRIILQSFHAGAVLGTLTWIIWMEPGSARWRPAISWYLEPSGMDLMMGWLPYYIYIYVYGYGSIPINTMFSGMNIHLPAILMFTRGTRFWHTAILMNIDKYWWILDSWWFFRSMQWWSIDWFKGNSAGNPWVFTPKTRLARDFSHSETILESQ